MVLVVVVEVAGKSVSSGSFPNPGAIVSTSGSSRTWNRTIDAKWTSVPSVDCPELPAEVAADPHAAVRG